MWRTHNCKRSWRRFKPRQRLHHHSSQSKSADWAEYRRPRNTWSNWTIWRHKSRHSKLNLLQQLVGPFRHIWQVERRISLATSKDSTTIGAVGSTASVDLLLGVVKRPGIYVYIQTSSVRGCWSHGCWWQAKAKGIKHIYPREKSQPSALFWQISGCVRHKQSDGRVCPPAIWLFFIA